MPGLGGTTNNYEILAQLASGGMAEIFLARVTAVGGVERHVVLKRILPAYKNDAEFVAMFLDEARLQAQFRHPNIAQLYDVGRLGNSYFYTMEYVHGETLAAFANKTSIVRDQVPLQHVLAVGAGVTAALHHAHTRLGPDRKPLGIVHRDVSPANVMVTYDGVVKLLDFGVAKSSRRQLQETRAGIVKGKVAYLAPEQIASKPLDGRCDLFSLGICLYELLTLHQLFARSSDLESLSAIVQEMPPPPSYFRKDVPREIDELVMRALAKDPNERYANADQMHEAIEQAATRTRLSMSPSSLGRHLGKLFGQRTEPWLDLERLAPVTVMGDIIPPTETITPPEPAPEAAKLEERIHQVPKITSEFDASDDFDDGASFETTDKRQRLTLPMAAAHPQWEATAFKTPLPEGFQAQVEQVLHERVLLPTPPTPVERMRPVQPRQPSQPSQSPQSPPSRSGGWNPPSVRASANQIQGWNPPSVRELPPEPTSWNVPRLVMAGAVLIGIIAAILVAVL